MGLSKELFTSMMEAMMEGISIEKEMARRMRDDQYRYAIYKKEKEKETEEEDVIGSFDENGDLI
jgi:hypothetical protein|tara:strand:+ start:386 stop:577 length:192 start_codon:yes stop_codon:yes gene_type:complete